MPFSLEKENYQQIHDGLVQAKSWLNSIGVKTDGTRFDKIIANVDLMNKHFKNKTLESLIDTKGNEELWFSLLESHAFVDIYEAFKDLKDDKLPRKKLQDVLDGPFLPREEVKGDANVNNRNFLFELELAARFKKQGVLPTGFEDIKFTYNEHNFNIQCKRIFSKKRVKDNIAGAYKQLQQQMTAVSGERGIIAISIEKIFETDRLILLVDTPEAIDPKIDKIFNSFRMDNSTYWEKFIDPRIVGIFVVLKFIIEIQNIRLLTRGTFIECIPLCSEKHLQFVDYHTFKELSYQLYPKT